MKAKRHAGVVHDSVNVDGGDVTVIGADNNNPGDTISVQATFGACHWSLLLTPAQAEDLGELLTQSAKEAAK